MGMSCDRELYCLKIFWSKCSEKIISKSQVGLGDIIDVSARKTSRGWKACGLGLI